LRVARSAAVVAAATLASRVLGLVRDIVLANLFQARATDAFFVAFTIPNLFRRLIGEGTLTVAFVPIFVGWLDRSRSEARRAFSATFGAGAAVGLAVTVAGIVFAEPLVSLFAPGFRVEPEKFELAVRLLRLCFPYIFFLTLVAIAMGALNAAGHFFAPAVAPVLLNLALIGGAFAGVALVEPPIEALGWAVIAAGLLQLLLQVPWLRRFGVMPRPVWEPGHPVVRRLAQVMAPAVIGASVYQFNLLVVRLLSSFEGDGAVSYLYYADRLLEFPLGVFVFALGTASLPSFSRLVKRGDRAGLRRSFVETLAMASALALASTAGLLLLREPLFSGLFAWRAEVFDRAAVEGCANALLCYGMGLPAITVSRICAQLCLAHEDTRRPARAAGVSLAVNLGAALVLAGPLPPAGLPDALVRAQHALVLADLGYAGLALATSLAAFANAAYLLGACARRYGPLFARGDRARFAKLGLATAALAGALWLAQRVLPPPAEGGAVALAVLAAYVAAGAIVYLGALRALRSPELRALAAILRRGRPRGESGLREQT
jgi:putative peptidoglycan lipid II flippase